MAQLTLRQAHEADHAPIVAAIQTWWGDTRTPDEARELSLLLPRLFLQHFAATSLILNEVGIGIEVKAEAEDPTPGGATGTTGVTLVTDVTDAGPGTSSAQPTERIAGFLVGFHSPDRPGTAYIHFVGVHPKLRHQGVARQLYERFFAQAAAAGRQEVRAIVSPANKPSIAFHRAMGFEPDAGDYESNGVPVHRDYDGPGHDRISFRRLLAVPPTATGATGATSTATAPG
ncbi:GNAT family N-acetyltransferase [Streptomyces zagrosensis]|uniref:Ribosomal protein S18 acetylase RimI-like enzyme n=1 Tax=Streptomyces zagrosensis TaxID=1042984 RepID=A0A7W9V0L8_9ACTN|nr:GNAT family N-acetyltransferase [Streptomyces zagrosensis]MBB5938265.1 ribosomal protein S18 acetylase RimI-like enzyme [Streptomyces zagrosensis]